MGGYHDHGVIRLGLQKGEKEQSRDLYTSHTALSYGTTRRPSHVV